MAESSVPAAPATHIKYGTQDRSKRLMLVLAGLSRNDLKGIDQIGQTTTSWHLLWQSDFQREDGDVIWYLVFES